MLPCHPCKNGEQCPLMCDVAGRWRVWGRVFSLEDVIWVAVGEMMRAGVWWFEKMMVLTKSWKIEENIWYNKQNDDFQIFVMVVVNGFGQKGLYVWSEVASRKCIYYIIYFSPW